jgi:hypothetical protein
MRTFLRLPRMRGALRIRRGGRNGRAGGAAAGLPLFMRTPTPPSARPEVRDDAEAHEAALAVGAHAFTRGDQIVLGPTVGTALGPTRDEALRHEAVHAAQVRRGAATGEVAPEDALEDEANAGASPGGRAQVRHGADTQAVHGLFFDEEEDDSSGSEESSSDSSRLGMQRTIWDHIVEAVTGVLEVGPVDAYAAGFGEDEDVAAAFARGFGDTWTRNAARHGVWQARLAFKYGATTAENIGNAHEEGSPNAIDSWVDQHNNRVAREIGVNAGSLDEIPDLIQAAMDDGRLITSPTDSRIPEALRETAPAP